MDFSVKRKSKGIRPALRRVHPHHHEGIRKAIEEEFGYDQGMSYLLSKLQAVVTEFEEKYGPAE
jgi:hypothetical protein